MKKAKRSMTRLIAMLLVVLCSLNMTCFAADGAKMYEATKIADKLYAEGLFSGYGKDANGKPVYGLEDSATRSQAVVMMVRIMGKADEAGRTEYSLPFVDVPDWAKPAVGYAYVNGLTAGTSASTFSPDATISNTEYITFCLRALGYDSSADFTWDKAALKAAEIGVVSKGEYTDRGAFFSRGDMVIISYRTLMTRMKNSDQTLAEFLGIQFSSGSTDPNVPASDLEGRKVEVTVVDAEDPSNLRLNNLGNMVYPIAMAPEGTVIKHSELVKNSNSAVENVNHFFETMNLIDGNVKSNSSGYVDFGGHDCGTYQVDGSNYKLSFTWSGKVERNIFLNALVYFGGEDMGTAVYCMLDEHYRFRSDKNVPISDEFAAKYGLTITVIENGPYTCLVNVSNGMDTWKVSYGIPGNDGMGSWHTIIYIPV